MCCVVLCCVQMEATPFGPRLDIVEFCMDNGIVVMCDNPLAKDLNVENHPAFLDICQGLDMTPQQVRSGLHCCMLCDSVAVALTESYCCNHTCATCITHSLPDLHTHITHDLPPSLTPCPYRS